jgi:hypothetical protein
MSNWSPEWRVRINGTDYTDITIANLSVTSGRQDINSQAVAGYGKIEILNLNQSAITVAINQGLSIAVKDSTGTFVNIFGGFVSDFSVEIASSGNTTYTQKISVTALGALSRLPKATTLGVLSKDFEGNQIYEILSSILLGTWNEVSASQTWAAYNPTTTWLLAENQGIGEIDQPGEYELTARSSNLTDAYSLVAALATSGLGYIYEDANGNISYADADHRQDYLSTNGFTELSANDAIATGIRIKQSVGTVKNKVTVTYKANATETAQDDGSIGIYGLIAESINTTLENSADASAQATRYLDLRAYPRFEMDVLTYALQNPDLDNTDRDALLNIFMGQPVKILDLPPNMLGGQFEGYIEGWSWSASVNGLYLTFYASPREFSEVAQKWEDVNVAEMWNSINATLEWENAIGVIS